MLASTPDGTVCYTDADLRDVAAVLAGAGSAVTLSRPVALIMLASSGTSRTTAPPGRLPASWWTRCPRAATW
jgi:hypothetical protein